MVWPLPKKDKMGLAPTALKSPTPCPADKCTWFPFIASLVAQMGKNLPIIQETPVQFLGWEDPLEKGMTTHSSILACRIPWTEKPGRSQRVGYDWATNTHIHIYLLVEYSCFTMLCYFLLYSKVNQPYIYPLFLRFLSRLSHHRALSRVCWALL